MPNEWKITLYASDDAETPGDGTKEGEYEFNVLKIAPRKELVNDLNYKADGSLDNAIFQRCKYKIKLLPFYIVTAREGYEDFQQSIHDKVLLGAMLKQPYLVIKSTDLPPFDGTNALTDAFPFPVVVRWNGEIEEAEDDEKGEIEVSFELENIFIDGITQPTPSTTENEYSL